MSNAQPTGSLKGRVALVTGAARGIGAASARALHVAGARVMLTDRDEAGSDTAATIGPDARFVRHDVTDEAGWDSALDACEAAFGGIDILVNNAGILLVAPLAETSLADFRRVQAVNVEGCFLGMKHAIPRIELRSARWPGGGAIVNISSIAGLVGSAHAVAYCASKGAIRLMTKAAALECAADGHAIRVNSVHPGPVQTAMQDQVTRDLPAHARSGNAATIAEPDAIADAVVFLASDAARFMTGSELVIDGGYSAR